ncbi:MAG: hypothetical protein H6650_20645 [Ardenticatenales bacterium]|nr:hypothetical protein [Ardenticatenales bacterium]
MTPDTSGCLAYAWGMFAGIVAALHAGKKPNHHTPAVVRTPSTATRQASINRSPSTDGDCYFAPRSFP